MIYRVYPLLVSLVVLLAVTCAPAYAQPNHQRGEELWAPEREPVVIFPAGAASVSGDVTSDAWFETPRTARGLALQCFLSVTTPSTGIQVSVQAPFADGTGWNFVSTTVDVTPTAQSHRLFLWPVGTATVDLSLTTFAAKKVSLPGKWRVFVDGANGAVYTVSSCEAVYLR